MAKAVQSGSASLGVEGRLAIEASYCEAGGVRQGLCRLSQGFRSALDSHRELVRSERLADGTLVSFNKESDCDLANGVRRLQRPDLGSCSGTPFLGQGSDSAPGHYLRQFG
eukprot:5200051-Alexandrium_andersonii.AAC.1